ncbi:MAG: ABC transporter ATP-binding protein, partial [SAR324 cluster bacterium]|nr:ABC transporter ATP-binding protein [SAR324 cluster bacterium]
MIFQDPYSSLNPRMNVEDILSEPLITHSVVEKSKLREKIDDLLDMVGLDKDSAQRYPHEFSGGQRQRICIARALAVNPSFIIADEPISALDVSIQAQIILLLKKLQRELDLTILFISHDLSVVKYLCDRVAVMYLGKIVEYSPKKKLFDKPFHPYTKALLNAIPIPNPRKERSRRLKTKTIKGEVPDILNLPIGCNFSTRCDEAQKAKLFEIDCAKLSPSLNQIGINHEVSCHLSTLKEKNV